MLTPKYFCLFKDFRTNILKKNLAQNKINFPVVSKPVNEGSSLGVMISKNIIELKRKTRNLFKIYDQLIFEEYIGGQEVQVAVLNKVPLGAIELIPKRSFYDYKAKYNKSANTEHVMPARLKNNKYKEVLKLAKLAHNLLGCRG